LIPNLVSIIIPVHNAEQYLRQAIDSVLCQTYQDIEVIAVDDGSKDNSVEILRGYGESINWFSQPNHGAAAARNAGVAGSG
jgi:glycosyltransferase involved in cell wall biosynthesis